MAGIIIADLTNRNPNVFYELGLAHASDKKLKQSLIETLKPLIKEKQIPFSVVKEIGNQGSGPGEFNELRGLVVGKEGRIYVSDMKNHRI